MYKIYAINNGTRLQLHDSDPSSKLKCLGTGKEAVNSVDSFELTLYPDNPGYNVIVPMQTMIEVIRESDSKRRFRGRALKPTGEMSQNGVVLRKFVFEGELSYLWDSVQSYHTANSVSEMFTMMLADHNAQMPTDKKIYVGQIIATSGARRHTWHYEKTMQAIQDYIRDYGGEIRLRYGNDDKMYLDYTSSVWDAGSDTKIELAVNMQSICWTVDPTVVASGIYPVGAKLHDDGTSAERLELHEVIWNADLIAKYGKVVTVVEWDDVTQASNLRTKATQWLANQSGELHQYSVQAVDLSKIDHTFDEFEVGTQYAVVNPLIGLDDVIRCIGKTWSINDITTDRLTFGDKYETLTALTTEKAKQLSTKIDKMSSEITAEQETFAKRVVNNQTALLRGAEGGYRYDRLDGDGKPIETFYLNSPSIETATQALRINKNGIGFWTGAPGGAIAGPYTAAWTIDGTFNTDYIVGRQITGFTFNNGNGTFVVNADGSVTARNLAVVNGSINCGSGKFTVDSSGNVVANSLSSNNATITGGSINIETASQTDDKIKLTKSEWKNSMSPLQWELENTNDDNKILCQAGGLFFYDSSNNTLFISQHTLRFFNSLGYAVVQIDDDGGASFDSEVRVTDPVSGNSYLVGASLKALFDRTGGP